MSGRGPNPIVVVEGTRQCIDCEEWKPLSDFKLLTPSTRVKTKSTDRMGRCYPCHLEWRKEYRRRDPERQRINDRRQSLKNLYGMTLEDYAELFETQGGVCAICGQPESAKTPKGDRIKSLAVDHCSATKNIRGLLCQDHNTAIGLFDHNPELLEAAIEYLAGNINSVGTPANA